MKSYKLFSIVMLSLGLTTAVRAQQGFGTNQPAASSVIDAVSLNKGVLLPRLPLVRTTSSQPILTPVNALTVFNTATRADVTPGYYYWSEDLVTPANSKWLRLLSSSDGAWSTSGNTATTSANFLGTTDAQALKFKLNNGYAGAISPINSNISFGLGALGGNTSPDDASDQLMVPGIGIGSSIRMNKSVAIGFQALAKVTIPQQSVALGAFALTNASETYGNTAIGYRSLNSATKGERNTALGWNALSSNINGDNNTAVGANALSINSNTNALTNISNNVAVGNVSLHNAITKFDKNIILGNNTIESNTKTAENSIVIGNDALTKYPNADLSNRLLIGSRTTEASGAATNALIDGDFTTKVLTINNTLKVADLGGLEARAVVADIDGTLKRGGQTAVYQNIRVTNNVTETIANDDYTIISKATAASTVALPNPALCKGRMLIIVNHSKGEITFNYRITRDDADYNSIQGLNGTVDKLSNEVNYTKTVSAGNKMTLQSTGSEWILVGI